MKKLIDLLIRLLLPKYHLVRKYKKRVYKDILPPIESIFPNEK